MPKTVNAAFDEMHGWLVPSSVELEAAASHRRSIEARLKSSFGLTSLFKSGSFGHGTSIRTISDVDYMAVIPGNNLSNNSTAALQKVRNDLAARFTSTAVHIRNPAVVIPFGTTAGEKHEITPAFFIEQSNGSNVYGISDRSGGWMKTSPHAHGAYINVINDKLGKRVKPLIRFMKLWNYRRDVGIRSFYLELRVAQYAAGETVISYGADMLRTLKHLKSKQLASMQDPMGVAGYVFPCTDAVKPDALSKIDTAIGRAERAVAAESSGNIQAAFAEWSLLFNNYFPKYG
jgi:hypothetical protein